MPEQEQKYQITLSRQAAIALAGGQMTLIAETYRKQEKHMEADISIQVVLRILAIASPHDKDAVNEMKNAIVKLCRELLESSNA